MDKSQKRTLEHDFEMSSEDYKACLAIVQRKTPPNRKRVTRDKA